MIILPPDHTVIREAITKHLESKKRNVIAEEWIADFDGTVYKLQSGAPEEPADGKSKDTLCLSIQVKGFDGVASATPDFLAQTCYAPYVRETETTSERTFNCTLQANIAELAKEDYEKFAYEWACLKRTILSFPLLQALQGLVDPAKASGPGVRTIEYRPEEVIYICPDEGKVTVVFSLSYVDPNDMEIAKVFLEEFRAAKRDRDIGTAPNVNYTPAPPGELASVTIQPSDARVGFLSFTFEKRHVASEEKLTKAIDMLFSLRSYMHYHIKCCKGYMHTRMRFRVTELLKVLNRADPSKVEKGTARSWGK